MDKTLIVIAVIIAVVVIVVVVLLRDQLLELFIDGTKVQMKAKMEAKVKTSEVEGKKPVSVVVQRNKLRGQGDYQIRRDANFSYNDVDGKHKFKLGYDEIKKDKQGKKDKQEEENQ